MRKIWNLPNTAYCNLLPLLCGCLPFHDEICRRFLNFVYKCMFSAVDVVRSVAHYASDFHMSFNASKSKCIVIFPSVLWSKSFTFRS